jgi:hypothetical protein
VWLGCGNEALTQTTSSSQSSDCLVVSFSTPNGSPAHGSVSPNRDVYLDAFVNPANPSCSETLPEIRLTSLIINGNDVTTPANAARANVRVEERRDEAGRLVCPGADEKCYVISPLAGWTPFSGLVAQAGLDLVDADHGIIIDQTASVLSMPVGGGHFYDTDDLVVTGVDGRYVAGATEPASFNFELINGYAVNALGPFGDQNGPVVTVRAPDGVSNVALSAFVPVWPRAPGERPDIRHVSCPSSSDGKSARCVLGPVFPAQEDGPHLTPDDIDFFGSADMASSLNGSSPSLEISVDYGVEPDSAGNERASLTRLLPLKTHRVYLPRL